MPSTSLSSNHPLVDALRALTVEPSITRALRLAEDLGCLAGLDADPVGTAHLLDQVIDASLRDGDVLTALGSLHAIGRVADDQADATLARLVVEGDPSVAGHAAWVLGGRVPDLGVVGALIDQVAAGGFEAMLAQRTLIQWAAWAQDPIIEQIGARTSSLAKDAALRLAYTRQAIATSARPVATCHRSATDRRLTVIQPFLHARLDAAGSRLGTGEAGGIASLLRSLGTHLGADSGIREVVTITRANPISAVGVAAGWERPEEDLAPGHRLARVRYGPSSDIAPVDAWEHRIPIEQELTRVACSLEGPVVWHVRMADVGTLAATAVARRLGHRIVFTVAPDPHAVIASRQAGGRLDRDGFGSAEASEHLWFRARMVERLAVYADRVVALPRPHLGTDLDDLLGLDVRGRPDLVTVIPEGVDTRILDQALARRSEQNGSSTPVDRICSALTEERRCLPWLLTVGRLHPLKGAHRLVEAWAGSDELRRRFNVVIVGGDLDDPSPTEELALDLIRRARGADGTGVVLAGHIPPDGVADTLAHAAAQRGIYVAASEKEEFGLAIVEALGSGLVVVAPRLGGAPTYVEPGETGIITDTTSVVALRRAIGEASRLVDVPDRAAGSRRFVRQELSVTRMAERLGDLYQEVVAESTSANELVGTTR